MPTTAQAAKGAANGGAVADRILAGERFGQIAGLDDNDLEAIYSLAYREFESGDYAGAERTFRVLCFYDHLSERFWMGLGAARQRLADYAGAIQAYSTAAQVGAGNPMAPVRAAECYIALGLYSEAVSGLETALAWAGSADDVDGLLSHVGILYQALEQILTAKTGGKPDAKGG
jgi:type III secretion system low calcium response chaperone LcrH/SycD